MKTIPFRIVGIEVDKFSVNDSVKPNGRIDVNTNYGFAVNKQEKLIKCTVIYVYSYSRLLKLTFNTNKAKGMSEISESIQAKCLAFGDRVIKLNDYLLEQASLPKSDGRSQKSGGLGKISLQPSVLISTFRPSETASVKTRNSKCNKII